MPTTQYSAYSDSATASAPTSHRVRPLRPRAGASASYASSTSATRSSATTSGGPGPTGTGRREVTPLPLPHFLLAEVLDGALVEGHRRADDRRVQRQVLRLWVNCDQVGLPGEQGLGD